MARIYLDHHATTPVDPRVFEAMRPYFTERFGNAASVNHSFGHEAKEAVETAREKIAALIGAQPDEIVFTSGATESNNLALKGADGPLTTVATEHKSVLEVAKRLGATILPVDSHGLVDLTALKKTKAGLVSVMTANNEIGTIQSVEEIGAFCHDRRILFHTDATQAAGKIPVDVKHCDLMSFSSHKMYGPKGVGALYVRKRNPRVRLRPLIDGGGHERGLRSGTLPVPLIVGFGEAASIASREMTAESARIRTLRDRLQKGIFEALDFVYCNGHPERRLTGNLNVTLGYVEGQSLLEAMPEVAVSLGSACSSAMPEPSHVLRAIGVSEDKIASSVRFGLGRFNTEREIDDVLDQLIRAVRRLRERSPLYETVRRTQ